MAPIKSSANKKHCIHANPRETNSGRGLPSENCFSEGGKMVHSVAFWKYNLFSQIFNKRIYHRVIGFRAIIDFPI
jgi:hypothetical protein